MTRRLVYTTSPDTDAARALVSRDTTAALNGPARDWARAEPSADALRASLARAAIVPPTLAVECREHDALPGVPCFHDARGVCAARIERSRHV